MLFYLGAQYKLLGRSVSAAACFREASENKVPGAIESGLVDWEMENLKNP